MITFNISIAENWKEKGYNYVLVVPRDKYGVLRPLTYEKSVQRGYTIQIDELKFIKMKEEYFLVKQKDGLTHDMASSPFLAKTA